MSRFHHLNKVQPPHVEELNLPPNTACVLYRKETVKVEPTAMPVLQPDGVLVKVISTGICGSDMHGYLSGGVGGRPVTNPTVMGHESSGEVIAVGELVDTHKIGDRVAIEPGLPCRRCSNCKAGRGNICLDMRYCGAPGSIGSLSRFYALPADMAPHIPDNVGWDEAGSIQPLAIGVQIGKRADIRAHHSIAIFGTGPIGLITAAVAHAYSASKIIGFDINPSRVKFAQNYISPLTKKPIFDKVFLVTPLPATPLTKKPSVLADHLGEKGTGGGIGDGETIDTHDHGENGANGDGGHEEETSGDMRWEWAKVRAAEWLEEAGIKEEGVDRVVEASGAEDSMMHGVAIAKQGGVFLQVGLGHIQTNLVPTLAITNKELDFRGITRYTASCFPSAIDMLARGVVDLKQLITAKFPLSRAKDALEAVRSGKEIKVLISNQDV